MRSKWVVLTPIVWLLATGAMAQSGDLDIKEVWGRATPTGAKVAAIYATITAPAGDRLTAVKTPAAQTAELHTMTRKAA